MVYIIHGQDQYLVKKNIKCLIKKNHKAKKYDYNEYELEEDTIANIINEIQIISLFEENKVIIINDSSNLWQKYIKEKKFVDALLNHNHKIMIIIKSLNLDFKVNKEFKQFNIIKVKNYTRGQLSVLVNKFCNNFKINITPEAIDFLLEYLPSDVNIFLNELSKLKSIKEKITLKIINDVIPRYFAENIFKTIAYLLKKDYKNFWIQYDYYNAINYDKIKLINILVYQLELIRGMKILVKQNKNNEYIAKALNISQFQVKILQQYLKTSLNINNILLKLYELDYNIKKGKFNKNIAIDLFFLNI
ncbi:DNA polymerase III subunit delta [Spiroplasma endosymbiont of Polydrusus pterygomalis]|uniref:DNA polymerase III subunit delta n=1 Tax=Spiroplasma endosymbiont of Polydrusus pterygomalis TaxID=3139327 RepID=UPI003CCB4FCC